MPKSVIKVNIVYARLAHIHVSFHYFLFKEKNEAKGEMKLEISVARRKAALFELRLMQQPSMLKRIKRDYHNEKGIIFCVGTVSNN